MQESIYRAVFHVTTRSSAVKLSQAVISTYSQAIVRLHYHQSIRRENRTLILQCCPVKQRVDWRTATRLQQRPNCATEHEAQTQLGKYSVLDGEP